MPKDDQTEDVAVNPAKKVEDASAFPDQKFAHPPEDVETNPASAPASDQLAILDTQETKITPTPAQIPLAAFPNTPISTLLTSIQQGFLFTPCSPLSPPQSYLHRVDGEEVGTPTPLPWPTRVQHEGHRSHDSLAQAETASTPGQRIPELASAFETVKMPSAVDDRQVLSDIEVNR